MAATGSKHTGRNLTQPPRSLRALLARNRMLRSSLPGVAVVLAVVLCALAVVFSPALSSDPATAATVSPAAAVDPSAPTVPIIFPMEKRISWVDTFGAARSGGRTHAGNDLMAPKMTPLLAVVDGTVEWLNLTGKLSSYNNLPYYNILLRGDDGNDYFYIHLNNDNPGTDDGAGGVEFAYASGLTNGERVEQGEVIGYVGDSGNAEDTASHLHFEIHLGGYVSASGTQTRSPSAIDPFNSLMAAPTLAEWEAAGGTAPTTKASVTTTTGSKPTTTTTESATETTAFRTTTTLSKSTTTTVAETVPGYADVRTTDWFYRDFAQAVEEGIVLADEDQRFSPYSSVSRALFTAYLVRTIAPDDLAELKSQAAGDTGAGTGASGWASDNGTNDGMNDVVRLQAEGFENGWEPEAVESTDDSTVADIGGDAFTDVEASYWAYDEIQLAARLGLVAGKGDGTWFDPDALVTRAQMATMLCRVLDAESQQEGRGSAPAYLLYEDIPQGYWAEEAIVMVNIYGLMCGDTQECFRPVENTNRAQAVTVMARLWRLLRGEAG